MRFIYYNSILDENPYGRSGFSTALMAPGWQLRKIDRRSYSYIYILPRRPAACCATRMLATSLELIRE